jgi:hypothetical protein
MIILHDTLERFGKWIEGAGPRLLAALVVLVIGWLVAKVVQVAVSRFLKVIKLDVLARKGGVEAFLERGNIKAESSALVGRLVYWVLLFLTLLIAVNVLGISEAQVVFSSVVVVIPRVILAIVILILGLSFAGFIADVVQTAATNARIATARLLANFSRAAITIFVAIVALNQFHIATEIVSTAVLILFGSVCFAASLAFGLGCRDLAGRIAQEAYDREKARAEAATKAQE